MKIITINMENKNIKQEKVKMIKFIVKEDILNFIKTLEADHNIYYLTKDQNYAKFSNSEYLNDLNIEGVRAITPLKAFFFINEENLELPQKPLHKSNIIFGVKNCDLQAKKILDNIFLGGICIDPLYKFHTENTLIFSSDCPQPGNSCWCTILNGKPYSEEGFDLNFSPVQEGFIVEVGTERGEKIITQAQAFFKEVNQEQLLNREMIRKKSIEKLDEINKEYISIKNFNFQELTKENFNSEYWRETSKTCVQCTGCNNICPSCYCFYLSDVSKENFQKIRYWDACHYTGYARVAGGANPRPKIFERFRNRYECKFNYRMTNFKMYACTGCGRCYDVSPCRIDIRKVLSGLKTNATKSIYSN